MASSNHMEPTEFDSMRKAAKSVEEEEGVIRYARNNSRNFIKKFEDESIKVFFIKGVDFTQVKCLEILL